MDVRIAERRAEVRRERMLARRRRSVALVGVVAAAGLLVAVERSPVVSLRRVDVAGTEKLDAATVRQAAALRPGTSILRLDLPGAEQRVEALPLVRDATLERAGRLTVRVDVEERRPIVVLATAGGLALVDVDGIVTAHLPPGAAPPPLPRIETPVSGAPRPGESLAAVPGAESALAVLRLLPGPLEAEVVRYRATDDGLVLVLAGGTQVRFGGAERVADKARTLGALLEVLGADRPAVIDVRAPAAPVVVPAPPGGSGGG